MRRAAVLGLAILPVLAWAAPALDIDSVAGVYKDRFANGLVDGTKFTSENILEVVKVSADKAYVRTHLEFYNGHECSLAAVMKVQGDALAYHEVNPGQDTCDLRLHFAGGKASFEDRNMGCKNLYCGMRGGFDGIGFEAKSRRPIRYMKKLLASSEYAEAVKAKP